MNVFLLGSDQRIVRAARVSFAKDEEVQIERDIKLIRYLLENRHSSPFEHVVIAFESSEAFWLELLRKVKNPTFQAYYDGRHVWLNLRNLINAMDHIPEKVVDVLRKRLPATYAMIKGEEVKGYSTDRAYAEEKIETSSGFVALIDKLELDSPMDYYTFLVECPIFVARQWFRHRFGSYNEVSRRYVSYEPTFYIPAYLRKQAKHNKQASLDHPVEEPWNSQFLEKIKFYVQELNKCYLEMLEKDVAREIARGILPQLMKTRFYWTVPRISLDNFISLRTHESAQKEIREFAIAIKDMVGYKQWDKTMRL
ncbi:FAD-dependent thymidylate synthase [Thermocrinis sp.]|uniref:FAD-dependent thymidylate synthase n=1 Tax=Thermocrinis sp. TaxID=2024383 RepID=UPI002FDDB4F5